jgi:hypothetical protein
MCMNRVIAKILQAVQQSLTKHAELAKETSATRSIHPSVRPSCCLPQAKLCVMSVSPHESLFHHYRHRKFGEQTILLVCTRRLNGILPSPLPSRGFIARSVRLVDMCDFGHERIVGIRVCQHGADAQEHCITSDGARRRSSQSMHTLRDGQSRTPLVPQDVQTDAAI